MKTFEEHKAEGGKAKPSGGGAKAKPSGGGGGKGKAGGAKARGCCARWGGPARAPASALIQRRCLRRRLRLLPLPARRSSLDPHQLLHGAFTFLSTHCRPRPSPPRRRPRRRRVRPPGMAPQQAAGDPEWACCCARPPALAGGPS